MTVAAAPAQTHRLPSLALRRFAWGVLAYFIAVILWGGLCGLPAQAPVAATTGRFATER